MSTPAPLTSKERARLRGEAHPLKPMVHVGKEGVTTAVIRGVEQALSGRSLLKVRVLEAAPDQVQDVAHAIAARVEGSTVLQVLGRTATLYRPMPEPKAKPAPAPTDRKDARPDRRDAKRTGRSGTAPASPSKRPPGRKR